MDPTATELPIEHVEFVAEWQAKLFAMVAALVANDVFDWADFRTQLIRLNHSLSTDPDEAKLATDLSLWAYALHNLLHERVLAPAENIADSRDTP